MAVKRPGRQRGRHVAERLAVLIDSQDMQLSVSRIQVAELILFHLQALHHPRTFRESTAGGPR